MELVAATKMRRSQEIALASRPYAFVALDLLASLTLMEKSAKLELPELLKQRRVKKVLFVLVASDKGLAGAFNSSVFKKFEQHMERDKEKYKNEEKSYVAVGEKAFQYLSKKLSPVVKTTGLKKFTQVGDFTTLEQVQPLTDFIVQGYLDKSWDRVVVISTHFRSALKQEPHVRRILPIDFDHIKETVQELIPQTGKFAELIKEQGLSFAPGENRVHPVKSAQSGVPIKTGQFNRAREYLIEPSPEKVLERLTKHLFFMQMYHIILEANASEHAVRRMAMKTASDNAGDLGQALNLQYNKSRQSAITNQIIEIIAGAESLS